MFNIKFVNDWIWTADLWYWGQPLYHLNHNHCPRMKLVWMMNFHGAVLDRAYSILGRPIRKRLRPPGKPSLRRRHQGWILCPITRRPTPDRHLLRRSSFWIQGNRCLRSWGACTRSCQYSTGPSVSTSQHSGRRNHQQSKSCISQGTLSTRKTRSRSIKKRQIPQNRLQRAAGFQQEQQ